MSAGTTLFDKLRANGRLADNGRFFNSRSAPDTPPFEWLPGMPGSRSGRTEDPSACGDFGALSPDAYADSARRLSPSRHFLIMKNSIASQTNFA